MTKNFDVYERHYTRMRNIPPNWEVAEKNTEEYACTRPWLPDNIDARILDFGCGWGNQLLGLWCAGYKNIEGVELVDSQAQICIDRAKGRIPITCMDGREYLSDKKSTYDLIILNDVFEHVPASETMGLLKNLRFALRSGGTLVIRVPNMANLFASYGRYLDITHVAGYTEYSLMQILDQAGFVEHQLVLPDWSFDLRRWRPWVPWRGLKLRSRMDHLLHKFLYWLHGYTKPNCYGHNVEIYTHKPKGD
jgi:2-polyprenyl-3-methyl-5-hydroxy-6-metoxy-1,4-benzoquinol methylase